MNKIRCFITFSICMLCSFMLVGQVQLHQFGWNPGSARDVNYSVHVERGLTADGDPEMQDDHTLRLHFPGDGTVDIYYDNVLSGSFTSASGEWELVNATQIPPYNGIILLSLLPALQTGGSQGVTWQTYFPTDSLVSTEDGKLSIQDQYQMTFTSLNDDGLCELDLSADTRVADNTFLRTVIDDVDGSPILNWNFFLTGAATYDKVNKCIQSAQLYYILMPETGYTPDSIINSIHRQYVIISKL